MEVKINFSIYSIFVLIHLKERKPVRKFDVICIIVSIIIFTVDKIRAVTCSVQLLLSDTSKVRQTTTHFHSSCLVDLLVAFAKCAFSNH